MVDELPEMKIKAIGIVKNEVKQKQPNGYEWWMDVISEIVIDPALTEALDGLEKYTDITVLYWMHRIVEGEVPLKVHPKGRKESLPRGTFATRSPNRPRNLGPNPSPPLQSSTFRPRSRPYCLRNCTSPKSG